MGHGIFEPIDDLKKDTEISHPELMAFLMKLMRDVDFDLKQFERILYNTPTYHRQVSTQDHVKGEPYYFSAPMLRRMSAEQLWDSLLSMTIQDCDERVLRDVEAKRVDNRKAQADYMLSLTPEQIVDLAGQIADIEMEYASLREENREAMQRASAAGNNAEIDRLEQERRNIEGQARRAVREAQRAIQKDMGQEMMMSMEMEDRMAMDKKTEVELDERWKGFSKSLVRSSELPSPPPTAIFCACSASQTATPSRMQVSNPPSPKPFPFSTANVQRTHEAQFRPHAVPGRQGNPGRKARRHLPHCPEPQAHHSGEEPPPPRNQPLR